jgi:hypothetical protein
MTHTEAFELLKNLPGSVYTEEIQHVEVQLTDKCSVGVYANSFETQQFTLGLAMGGYPSAWVRNPKTSVFEGLDKEHFALSFWFRFYTEVRDWDLSWVGAREEEILERIEEEDEEEKEEFTQLQHLCWEIKLHHVGQNPPAHFY